MYELADDSPIEDEKFDIVDISLGVLFWLPDFEEWADIVMQFVRGDRAGLIVGCAVAILTEIPLILSIATVLDH